MYTIHLYAYLIMWMHACMSNMYVSILGDGGHSYGMYEHDYIMVYMNIPVEVVITAS